MIEFAWPWLISALLLPFLTWVWLPPKNTETSMALRVPKLSRFKSLQAVGAGSYSFSIRQVIAYLCFALIVVAAMRPQWLGEAMELPSSGRDLMLGIDISGSMQEQDFVFRGQTVSRIAIVKHLGKQFIERRSGDRVGLILFGSQAYVQTPLTYDTKTVTRFLDEATVGLAGKSTAIGDAIGLSLKRLRERPEGSRVLVLLTDGTNTAGEVTPLDAANLAKNLGIKIYTIGVGADRGRSGIFGFASRQPEIDEKTLTEVAEQTGGRYFRAKNTQEMEKIYTLIDELEPSSGEGESLRPLIELFPWPLGIAFLLGLAYVLLELHRQLRGELDG